MSSLFFITTSCDDPSKEIEDDDQTEVTDDETEIPDDQNNDHTTKYRIKSMIHKNGNAIDSTVFTYEDNKIVEYKIHSFRENIWTITYLCTINYQQQDIYMEKFLVPYDLLLNTYNYEFEDDKLITVSIDIGPEVTGTALYLADQEDVEYYTYNNNQISMLSSEKNGIMQEYKYNSNQEVNSIAFYGYNDELPQIVDTFYYVNDRIDEIKKFFRSSELHYFSKVVYEYDDNNRVENVIYYLTEDDSWYSGHLAYTYNTNGLLEQTAKMDEDQVMESITYRYEPGEGNAIIFNNEHRIGLEHNPTYIRENNTLKNNELIFKWRLAFK